MSSGSSPHPPTGGKERAGPCHPLGGGGGGGGEGGGGVPDRGEEKGEGVLHVNVIKNARILETRTPF